MNKYTPTNLSCQLLNNKINSNPTGFITNELSPAEQRILPVFIRLADKYKRGKLFIGRPLIAHMAKCSIKTVSRTIAKFKSLGILDYIERRKKTHEYLVNEFFFTKSMRKTLSFLYTVLIPFALSLLLSSRVEANHVPPLNINEIYSKSNSDSNSDTSVSNNYARVIGEQHGYEIFDKDFEDLNLTKEDLNLKSEFFRKMEQEESELRFELEFEAKKEKRSMEAKELLKANSIGPKLGLTMHGVAKLCSFSVEALDYAESKIDLALKANDPFLYFQHLCKDFSERNKIPTDWRRYFDEIERLKIDKYSPYVDAERLAELKAAQVQVKAQSTKKSYQKGKQHHDSSSNIPEDTKANLARGAQEWKDKLAEDARKLKEYESRNLSVYEAILECEQKLHIRLLSNPEQYYYNFSQVGPVSRWESLTLDQKKAILGTAHPHCSCRDGMKIQVGMITPEEMAPHYSAKNNAEIARDKIISRPVSVPVYDVKIDEVVTVPGSGVTKVELTELPKRESGGDFYDPTDFDSLDGSYFEMEEVL